MGREGGSSAGAIAVIVVGGILAVLALGCVGLGAVGLLFSVRSSPQMVAPAAVSNAPQPVEEAPRVITNNAEGLALIDGQVYTDEALREHFAAEAASSETMPALLFEFTPELSAERRAEIEQTIGAGLSEARGVGPTVEPSEATPSP